VKRVTSNRLRVIWESLNKRTVWETHHGLSERFLVIVGGNSREQAVDALNIELRLSERGPYDADLYVRMFERIPDEQDGNEERLACLATPSHYDREKLCEGICEFPLIVEGFHSEELFSELNRIIWD